MSNMSYCRFRNTMSDLQDCYDALGDEDIDALSPEERRAALHLIRLCSEIASDFDYLLDPSDA